MDRKQLIQQAAREAGALMLKFSGSARIIENKSGAHDFATEADLACEKLIIQLIQKHFPDDQILAEESAASSADPLQVKRLWVIDPIDGTYNFSRSHNYSAVSIGYVEKGRLKLGVIYNPFVQELFSAQAGHGALLNDQPLQCGTTQQLAQALVNTDPNGLAVLRYHLELALKTNSFPSLYIKGSACLAMAEVAAGRSDLYFHSALKPWDNAAAFLIVREAGGVVKDFSGQDAPFTSANLVAGNAKLVKQFLKVL